MLPGRSRLRATGGEHAPVADYAAHVPGARPDAAACNTLFARLKSRLHAVPFQLGTIGPNAEVYL